MNERDRENLERLARNDQRRENIADIQAIGAFIVGAIVFVILFVILFP